MLGIHRRSVILALACFLFTFSLYAQSYNWKSVQIKGGGFVTGIVYSKADPTLLYARTDVGGAYRWNSSNKTWIPLTDAMMDDDDWGVWSIAPDPTNANKVYMATGLYSASWGQNGAIYSSSDKGATWSKISALSIKLGGNDPGRGSGERLIVDPNKPSILFLGSKKDGLYKSTDSGVNWSKVSSLPSSYLTFVEFDKSTGTTGNATPTIYAGVADNIYNGGNVGVYRSTDGGTTWNKLFNHPTALTPKSFAPGNAALTTVPTDMYITPGNVIYFTYSNTVTPDGEHSLPDPHKVISNGAVYKFDKSSNVWTDITPSNSNNMQGGFSSIAVSSSNPDKIAVATIGRWWPHDELYFSSNGGTNWSTTFNSYNYESTWGSSLNKGVLSTTKAPYAGQATIGWPSCIAMNPNNDKEVMIGYGGGIFACYDVSPLFTNANSSNTASTTWVYENDGLEETVALEIVSPPSGAPLVSALGDVDGFVHINLDESPAQGKHKVSGGFTGTSRSIAFAENNPNKMVRAYDNDSYNKGAYSTDGGLTWTAFASKPSGVNSYDGSGKITISADGNRILWASANATIAYSTNNGSNWSASAGSVPNGFKPIADRVNSSRFYVFDPQNQKLYYSTDGAVSFSNATLQNTNGIPDYEGYQPELCAVFGNEGHLWLANSSNGLFRSTNGGLAWTKVPSVTSAIKVTVGKAATGSGYPAVFIWGVVNGVSGAFRSDDQGATWERINDSSTEWAGNPTCMAGDQRIYGRVYIGIGGRGIVYGDRLTVTGFDLNENLQKASAYPNPFKEEINIQYQGSFKYSIYSIEGKLLGSDHANDFVTLGSQLLQGIYIVKVYQGDKTMVLRVVKE